MNKSKLLSVFVLVNFFSFEYGSDKFIVPAIDTKNLKDNTNILTPDQLFERCRDKYFAFGVIESSTICYILAQPVKK